MLSAEAEVFDSCQNWHVDATKGACGWLKYCELFA